MSDIWYYDLIIPPRHLLDPGELHVVDKLIKKVGFSMKNPYTGNITAFRVDKSTLEFTCHDFQDLVSLSHLTGIDRTNITIWKEDIDITIEFNLSPSLEAAYPINSKSGNFSASRLSIAIDNTFYRDILLPS